jgi:hypothetical protein
VGISLETDAPLFHDFDRRWRITRRSVDDVEVHQMLKQWIKEAELPGNPSKHSVGRSQ